jgi:ribose 5-phosphate isomerase A
VAQASRELLVIADETKLVPQLGRYPLPIEVVEFGLGAVRRGLAAVFRAAGCEGPLRMRMKPDGHVFVTDQGHLILDAALGRIPDVSKLARGLADQAGVVEHGLFIGLARRAILATGAGVQIIERS